MATRNHVVGPGVQIRGALQGSGDLTLRGTLAGELLFLGAVRVEQGGRLEIVEGARGSVESLVVAGTGSGEIHGSVSLTVQAGGVFAGALVAPVVVVQEGARVRGWIETTGKRPEAAPTPATFLPSAAPVAQVPAAEKTVSSSTPELQSAATEPEPAGTETAAAETESVEESAPDAADNADDTVDSSPAEEADESDADAKPATNSAPAKGSPNRGKRR